MFTPRPDGAVDAMCSRCLRTEHAASAEVLVELGWEAYANGQTWCADCSSKARCPPFPTNQRGVRRKRPSD